MEDRGRVLLHLIPRGNGFTFAAAIAAAVVAFTGVGGTRAGAAPDAAYAARFSGAASGNGIRITSDVANSVDRKLIDGGGPSAEARVDSIGNSTAFASHPYPGEIPLSGPGLLAGAIGDAFPMVPAPNFPAYPFYVESKHPLQPHAEMTGPAQTLEAASDSVSSSAKATSGFGSASGSGGFVRSAATVEPTVDGVLARGESRIEGFVAGPLRMGEVISTAEATLHPDGSVSRDAQITVTAATVDGVPVTIDDQGLTVADSEVPFPSSESVAESLERADIYVALTPKEVSDSGVVAPAVKIVQELPQGNGTITYVIGSSAARVDGSAVPPVVGDAGECTGPCDGPDGGEPATIPAAQAASPPPAPVNAPAVVDQEHRATLPRTPGRGGRSHLPGLSSPLHTGHPAPPAAGANLPGDDSAAQGGPQSVALVRPSALTGSERLLDTSGLSLIVLVAGAAGLVVSQLQRVLGVRNAWPTMEGKETS